MARERDLDGRDFWTGTVKRLSSGYTYNSTCFSGSWAHCSDVVGNYEADNAFVVDRQTLTGGLVDGYVVDAAGNKTRLVTRLVPDGIGALYRPADPRSFWSVPDFNLWAPQWIPRLMPLQPKVNLPLLIGEGRDLPELVTGLPDLILGWGRMRFGKHAGRAAKAAKLAKQAAQTGGNANLWYRFGVSPTVADVGAMLGLLDGFLAAFEDLMNLKHRGCVKRSLRLPPNRSMFEDGSVLTHSAGVLLRHNRVRVARSKSWVTARWVPLIPGYYSGTSRRHIVEEAWKRALGLSPSGLATAWWELLPWSWLTDWFANIQRLLALLGGLDLLLRLESLCYMRTTTLDTYWSPTSIPVQLEADGACNTRVVKERIPLTGAYIGNAGNPSLPALSGVQLGILGSLLATLGLPRINPSTKSRRKPRLR